MVLFMEDKLKELLDSWELVEDDNGLLISIEDKKR